MHYAGPTFFSREPSSPGGAAKRRAPGLDSTTLSIPYDETCNKVSIHQEARGRTSHANEEVLCQISYETKFTIANGILDGAGNFCQWSRIAPELF